MSLLIIVRVPSDDLESEPHTQEHRPRRAGCAVDLAECRAGEAGTRIVEVWVVQRVEHVSPKLSAKPLAELEPLRDRGVEVEPAGPVKSGAVTTQVAERRVQDAIRSRSSRGGRRVNGRVEIELARAGVTQDRLITI